MPVTFEEAVAAVDADVAADRASGRIDARALPRLLAHGATTDDAVVLFHGFTTCPQQFVALAERFHARGATVYVPRIPLHGERDRLTRALNGLTAAAVAALATRAHAIAQGLGRRVSVVGLSLGGAMALQLAQTAPVDHAVAVSPFLMPIGFPSWLGLVLMRALALAPSWYQWWDPRVKEGCLPDYAYPGFPTHALATCIRYGHDIVAAGGTPAARRVTLVTNRTEPAVNNGPAVALVDRWRERGARADHLDLDGLGRRHDIIDPTTFPAARTLVYPHLEALVLGA